MGNTINNVLFDNEDLKQELKKLNFILNKKEVIPPTEHPFGKNYPKLEERVIYNIIIPDGCTIELSKSNPTYWSNIVSGGKTIAEVFQKIGQYTEIRVPKKTH